MKPGDIARVKSRGVIVALRAEPPDLSDLLFTEKDEVLLVLGEVIDQSIKILHPRLGVGWITHERLEVISEAR